MSTIRECRTYLKHNTVWRVEVFPGQGGMHDRINYTEATDDSTVEEIRKAWKPLRIKSIRKCTPDDAREMSAVANGRIR